MGEDGSGDANEVESGDRAGRRRRASTAETVAIAVSVVLTVLLFGFAGWQIVSPPAAETPQATVVHTESLADGRVAVTVRLANPSDAGLVSATVASNCSSPPTTLSFSYVPASSSAEGTLVCPPGTTDPTAAVTSWQSQ